MNNNFQNLQQSQQSQPEVNFLDVLKLLYQAAKIYYRDVYWDNNSQRYRNSKGEFVSEWKGNLFK